MIFTNDRKEGYQAMNTKNILSSTLRYLDKALNGLRDLGLMPQKPDEMPVITLINQISDLDEEKTIAIARTLSNTTVFNEVVREQITAMNVGERYETITKSFDSIRDDAKSMVEQLDDGKIDTMERLSNFWMKVTRGDIPSRFAKIKGTYMEVSADTKDQIERENLILESYRDFRGALKESQVMAFQVLKKASLIGQRLSRFGQLDHTAFPVLHGLADLLLVAGTQLAHFRDQRTGFFLKIDHRIQQFLDTIRLDGRSVAGPEGILLNLVAHFGQGFQALVDAFFHRFQCLGAFVQALKAGKRGI